MDNLTFLPAVKITGAPLDLPVEDVATVPEVKAVSSAGMPVDEMNVRDSVVEAQGFGDKIECGTPADGLNWPVEGEEFIGEKADAIIDTQSTVLEEDKDVLDFLAEALDGDFDPEDLFV